MKDFAAIDFETANACRSSVCSVGIVLVEDGRIVGRHYELIRPCPNYYHPINTRVHGLTAADTDTADDFPTVWGRIAPLIGDMRLVAHNSPFDEGCLKAAFAAYDMPYPGYTFLCTCRASRAAFGRMLPNHQLQTVAAHCGYDLRSHHHALADAEACAAIALKLL